MDLYPPAQTNKRVTEAMTRWVMMQPSIPTIPIPDGVDYPKDLTIDKMVDMFEEWRKAGVSLEVKKTLPSIKDFPIDDRTKDFILFELQKILEFNGFKSELLANGSLRVSKNYWRMDIEKIHNQLPFPDYLPHQIEQAYKNQYQNNLHSSQEVKIPRYGHPSREYLESVRKTITDNTEGDL